MKRSLNDGYDSRDVFISPSGIIAMINRAINNIVVMIPEMILVVLLESKL